MNKKNQKIKRVTQILLVSTFLLSTSLYGTANGEQYVISSPAVDIGIPDNSTLVTSAIADGLRSKITDIDIIFTIFHTRDADLNAELVSPTGTRVTLFGGVGGTGDNFLSTRLDDEAQMTFYSGVPLPPEPPYENLSIQPFGNLSDFDGENPNGTWVLEVTDDQEFVTGILSEWRLVINAESKIIYVDWFQGGSQQDGESWGTAYRYLQDGLSRAITGDQVWITGGAGGVSYYPDESLGNPDTNDPNDTFALNNGVEIYGGFKGDESSIAERDLTDNESVLSGDIGTWNDTSDNSHHVINAFGCDSNTILDSFTVTAGNAHGSGMKQFGGGMYNEASNPIIRNCKFIDNLADRDGGAIYNDESSPVIKDCNFSGGLVTNNSGAIHNFYNSSPVIKNCTFTTNVAEGRGGAIYNEWDSCPTIIQSAFKQNLADYGGALYNAADCNATLINCSFAVNWAAIDGGAVFNTQCNPVVINSIFQGNQAGGNGGGMLSKNDSAPVITSCTFSGNFADNNGGGICNQDSSLAVIRNSIFWENKDQSGTAETAQIYGFFPDIANSCIDDDNPGDGDEFGILNIDTDPMFKSDPNPGPDALWRTPDDDIGDLRLQYGSGCIETGDNDSIPPDTHDLDNDGNNSEPLPYDLDNHNRLIDWNRNFIATVDMGAYERGVCPGNPNFDGSGLVNFADFAMFAAKWLDIDCDCHGSCCDGTDLNSDEIVDFDDLEIFVDSWLENQNTILFLDFDNLGAVLPSEIAVRQGAWAIGTATDFEGKVLKSTGYGHNVIEILDVIPNNISIEFDFLISYGDIGDLNICLNSEFTTYPPTYGYDIGIYPDNSDNHEDIIRRFDDGIGQVLSMIANPGIVHGNEKHCLRIVRENEHIRVYLDYATVPYIEADDDLYHNGKMFIRTWCPTTIDNILIEQFNP